MDNSVFWSPGMKLEDLERLVIEKAYKHYRENKTATANSLGISIRTLDSRLDKYEMDAIEEEHRNGEREIERRRLLDRSRGIVTEGSFYESQIQVAPHGYDAGGRVRAEPIANASEKPSMPMPVGEKVQEVLPSRASGDRSGKRR